MAKRDCIYNDHLEDRALEAQVKARLRPATPDDCFLLTSALGNTKEDNPVAVLALSGSEEEKLIRHLVMRAPASDGHELPSEREARRTFDVQLPNAATRFGTDRATYSSYLPGGAPLVDHLYVRIQRTPDWACLEDPVQLLRRRRIPCMEKVHNVEEFTLGETDERRVNDILEYLQARVKQTKSKFGVCLMAADTESVSVTGDGYRKVIYGRAGQTHLVDVATSGESGDPLPVVLMVGHVDWQINIRLPIHETVGHKGRKQLQITPGTLQDKALEFFRSLDVLTGVNVTDDLRKFFKVVKVLFGEDLWEHTEPPLELDILARYSGYNLVRYSLSVLNHITFGTIMPKGRASVGDGKWHKRYLKLPKPLQTYMVQDISQAAGIAWVMLACWTIHVFPDAHAVTQCSTLSPPKIMKWWYKHVVANVVSSTTRISPWQIANSREEMMIQLICGSEDKKVALDLLPDWPSVAAGGARFVHTVRSFLVQKLEILHRLDRDTWPIMQKEQYHLFRFGRFEVQACPSPIDPVRAVGFVANPGVGPTLCGPAQEITRDTLRQLKGHGASEKAILLEYIRLNPFGGRDLLERVESSHEAGKKLFGFLKRAYELVPLMRTTLAIYGMLPLRPEGWVDNYSCTGETIERVRRLAEVAVEMSQHHQNKAELLKLKSRLLKTAAKNAKRKLPDTIDHHTPLVNLVTPQPSKFSTLSRRQAMQIGETAESQPLPKRRRLLDEDSSTGPRDTDKPAHIERPRPEETITSGAWEAEQGFTIQRTVNLAAMRREEVLQSDSPADGTRSSDPRANLASQDPKEWRPLLPEGTMALGNIIYVVGQEHAQNFSQAFRESISDEHYVIYIPLEEWSDDAIQKTVRNLQEIDLQEAIVLFWLHDEEIFVHAASGNPLTRGYDSRLHCMGALGTISQSKMQRLWAQSWPLLEACMQAAQIVLITPIPMYITTPCCEILTHCVGYGQPSHIRGICTSVAGLRDATLRWVSRIDSDRIAVVSPHLEIMEAAQAAKEDWVWTLRDSYTYDGVHFSYTGNRDFGALLWETLQNRFWKLRPPCKNMRSPQRGPIVDEGTPRRSRRAQPTAWDYIESEELAPVIEETRHVTYNDAEIRNVLRGPWINSEVQDSGPIISPDTWDRIRSSAYASGYDSSRLPANLHPE